MPDVYETQQADSAGDSVVGVDFRYVELILISHQTTSRSVGEFYIWKSMDRAIPTNKSTSKKTTIRHAQSDK